MSIQSHTTLLRKHYISLFLNVPAYLTALSGMTGDWMLLNQDAHSFWLLFCFQKRSHIPRTTKSQDQSTETWITVSTHEWISRCLHSHHTKSTCIYLCGVTNTVWAVATLNYISNNWASFLTYRSHLSNLRFFKETGQGWGYNPSISQPDSHTDIHTLTHKNKTLHIPCLICFHKDPGQPLGHILFYWEN